jgi:hypothetical protein
MKGFAHWPAKIPIIRKMESLKTLFPFIYIAENSVGKRLVTSKQNECAGFQILRRNVMSYVNHSSPRID